MIRRICLGLALALLCFTVSAKPQPLPMPLAPDLPVEVVLSQHELAVDVPDTAAAIGMQFGLIGALIGTGIQNAQVKNAEEHVGPLRDQLLDYHFNARVESVLRAKLASDGLSPAPRISVLQTPWEAAEAHQDKQTMPLHALVITPRYAIDAGFSTLSVSLFAQLVDRTIKANGKVKTRVPFSRNYAFRFPLMAGEGENPARWARLGAARLGAMLDEGIAQATDMLVYDFSAEGRAQWDQKIKHETATIKGISYPGLAVRQSADWVWVRGGRGFLQTLQGYEPVDPAAPAAVVATPAVAPAAAEAAAPAVASTPVPAPQAQAAAEAPASAPPAVPAPATPSAAQDQ